MINLSKINHRNSERLLIKFPYNNKVKELIRSNKSVIYTLTYKGFYVNFTKTDYNELVTLFKKHHLKWEEDKSVKNNFNKDQAIISYAKERTVDFIDFMKYRNYSKSTITTYSSIVYYFLLEIDKEIPDIDVSDIEYYNKKFIIEKGFSLAYQNQMINAVKLFFSRNNGISFDINDIERPRKSMYLPTVLSKEEIKSIFSNISNLKHRTILSLIYSSGLRIGETLNLKVNDIDSQRNLIMIRQGKGHKDRIVGLSPKILELLRKYYHQYKPSDYLFVGQKGGSYSQSSIRAVFRRACKKAGIKKQVRIHSLRHSYATHLLESGTDIRYIQDILGHKDPKTTMIYTHVSNKNIKNITSPFDMLDD